MIKFVILLVVFFVCKAVATETGAGNPPQNNASLKDAPDFASLSHYDDDPHYGITVSGNLSYYYLRWDPDYVTFSNTNPEGKKATNIKSTAFQSVSAYTKLSWYSNKIIDLKLSQSLSKSNVDSSTEYIISGGLRSLALLVDNDIIKGLLSLQTKRRDGKFYFGINQSNFIDEEFTLDVNDFFATYRDYIYRIRLGGYKNTWSRHFLASDDEQFQDKYGFSKGKSSGALFNFGAYGNRTELFAEYKIGNAVGIDSAIDYGDFRYTSTSINLKYALNLQDTFNVLPSLNPIAFGASYETRAIFKKDQETQETNRIFFDTFVSFYMLYSFNILEL